MNLIKVREDSTTITLGWEPPADVDGYVLFANGVPTVATASLKSGAPRREAKFSKTNPGPPFEVAATCRSSSGSFRLETAKYGSSTPTPTTVFPSATRYPSEVLT